MIHELKCWPEQYQAIKEGRKTFEVRTGNDRKYAVGDWVILKEYDPKEEMYTDREMALRIQYVMHGKPFLPANMWVFGLYFP